ncbi:hypothetical protein Bcav_3828 [Beutenbergia cavernae DSM 12333]|uniref:Uncharacterized protein n=1 Tax=Beutenbergia cavernae (strain ATCC BAA-8 / DSM 12333 / CCUG 43141 / JCM 11478 / NBRC 16432 / NCIMB 13614 / HKI 0122) TaxID=471853 RepID=C5C4E6_BEUC1|nr:hypothetical protein [Beutenbergia cavernae]ACQ82070.1 hypothetical protein Bcav_3828 [Beutenbergia cavernae DSM 12333]
MTELGRRAGVSDVVARVIERYRPGGSLAFAYGQGSVLSGIVADSDLDVVMIWADGVPTRSARPARALATPGTDPVQHDGAFGGLDSFDVDGWPVDVAHHTQEQFRRWVAEVLDGAGWQRQSEWPSPLFAVSGFAYGEILADDAGLAREVRARLEAFPARLHDTTRTHLDQMRPAVLAELAGCVRRSDGWLFHELASDLVRTAYLAWFAAHCRYCPFPKRTAAWAQRFGLEPELIDVEQRIWSAAGLDERLELIAAFSEGVLAVAAGDSA